MSVLHRRLALGRRSGVIDNLAAVRKTISNLKHKRILGQSDIDLISKSFTREYEEVQFKEWLSLSVLSSLGD